MSVNIIKKILENKSFLKECIKINNQIVISKNFKVLAPTQAMAMYSNIFDDLDESVLSFFDFGEFLRILEFYEKYTIKNCEINDDCIKLTYENEDSEQEIIDYPLCIIENPTNKNKESILANSVEITSFKLTNLKELKSLLMKANIEDFVINLNKNSLSFILKNESKIKIDKKINIKLEHPPNEIKKIKYSVDYIKSIIDNDYDVIVYKKSTGSTDLYILSLNCELDNNIVIDYIIANIDFIKKED